METRDILEYLKAGIKGELDSIINYEYALQGAEDESVKSFFRDRIEEEKTHYNYLLDHYNQIDKGKPLNSIKLEVISMDINEKIFSRNFLNEISKKQTLFSALSTAALLEKNAMDFYRKCAANVDDKVLKDFFRQMSDWEARHYEEILSIQKDTEKEYWTMNRFYPF